MSDLKATVTPTSNGFSVAGTEQINYGFQFVDNIFSTSHSHLADIYKPWGRVLLVTDAIVNGHYATQWEAYFKHHGISLTTFIMAGGEKNKTMKTMLSIVDAMNDFGLVRKEPVLVVGGGLCTDVTGFACASYRRTTNFIRVPTTLIGLIDASVSIKVGINHGTQKNRLGAYHAPLVTFLDFNMLRTLPEAQVRNGFAELMKISSCADKRIWDLLVANGEQLIQTRFGRVDSAPPEMKKIADEICWRGIKTMLDLESPNLHEIGLDRVIAFGHSLSPTLELAPAIPLRHGHAINIDMAYFVTFACTRGILTEQQRDEYHLLSHRVGLSMDHAMFTEELVKEGTQAILKTRDNKQRFAVPNPYGKCTFINDATYDELFQVLKIHKQLIKEKYGSGDGKDAYVDSGDLGMDPALLERKAKDTMDTLRNGFTHVVNNVVEGINGHGAAMAASPAGMPPSANGDAKVAV
ncbi:2-epi-5-epi-valiolone synthase [Cristinia sonorae]|uniref:2-epi-5-epi-valiolone synthase n=1 Tax=Cristinia sonorae TaxID=1940300 RepID=A0A8K0UHP4_9AGAR|nr:2-epi-5-epi-valiolone synthase [Cristinia sonorae]